jgi:UTP--glucose-1-phosphate uridylyltransferase
MVKDYFTLEPSYIKYLIGASKYSVELEELRRILADVNIEYVQQTLPNGFGDAVLKARKFVSGDSFLLHAGDGYLLNGVPTLQRLLKVHTTFAPSATVLTRVVENPTAYGIVSGTHEMKGGERLLRVNSLVEKPENPPSNHGLTAVYTFGSALMDALSGTRPGRTGEIELTDGVMEMVRTGKTVYAIELDETTPKWLSVGSPENYLRSLEISRLSVESSPAHASKSLAK